MRILGLSSLKHDTAACLLEDGAFIAAIENDKLERSRTRGLPNEAILSCFETASTNWEGIDTVAIASRPGLRWARKAYLRAKLAIGAPAASAYYAANEASDLAHDLNDFRVLRRYAERGKARFMAYDHHLCHAAAAFYLSPFDRALIVTVDEDGDGNSGLIAVGEAGKIRDLRKIPFPHSLAWVYSQITDLAGFRPHMDEHETQWLSLEGEPRYKEIFVRLMRGKGSPWPCLDYTYFNHGLSRQLAFSGSFYKATGLPLNPAALTEEQRKDVAASMQAACFEIVAGIVEHLRKQENIQNVCFGGGLFQNVLLVSDLENRLGADTVFVPPAPGNAGTAMGAACLAWKEVSANSSKIEAKVYLGPRASRAVVKDSLDNSKSRYQLPNTEERTIDAAVHILQAGKALGWFQGATEFGPRALGNRSVLASPWAPYVKENLNDFIKHREWFRPFAISIPEEDCSNFFDASRQCYVLNSLATLKPGIDCLPESFLLPGRRVRLHVVSREANPVFWLLLKRFGEDGPAPMLLNTSFNLFGEPLVVTPRDAMRSYFGSGLDALIMERFILTKEKFNLSKITLPIVGGIAANQG